MFNFVSSTDCCHLPGNFSFASMYFIFLLESVVACAIFTLFVFLMSRNPIKTIFNYPPALIGMHLGIPTALMAGIMTIVL